MGTPKYSELFNPALKALHDLGGSATTQEMDEKVAEQLNLTENDLNEIQYGSRTKFNYRLAWARNYLKRFGLFENSERGVWILTQSGYDTDMVDELKVVKYVKDLDKKAVINKTYTNTKTQENDDLDWQEEMLNSIKNLSPSDFERLCQRILRESGFVKVIVTGKSNDGGIDGRGIVKIGGFLSFRIIFQCKRYKGNISSQLIREFKGTMAGRADKGLFMTTGSFTTEAKKEAERDGTAPIDLVDGYELVEKMKELGLAVTVKTEEVITVDPSWFEKFTQ